MPSSVGIFSHLWVALSPIRPPFDISPLRMCQQCIGSMWDKEDVASCANAHVSCSNIESLRGADPTCDTLGAS